MGRRCRVSLFPAYSRKPWQQSSIGAAADWVKRFDFTGWSPSDEALLKGHWCSIITGLAAFFFLKHSKGLTESLKALPTASSDLPALDWSLYPRPSSPDASLACLTFVPDQVVAEEDEQDEQQKYNESHNPTNDGVVSAGGRGHRTGVWREGGMYTAHIKNKSWIIIPETREREMF